MPDGSLDSTANAETSPAARYHALLEEGVLHPDKGQAAAAGQLQQLHESLDGYQPGTGGLLARLGLGKRSAESPQGLYLHGPVGRGKSMLMDLFFNAVTVEKKRRVHFHAFMLEIQQRLNEFRRAEKRSDPLMSVAANVAGETWLLCFDEFHVVNIADAMILGRLFQGLFEHGVVIVATSNVAPQDLYKGGLQRERFLPSIDLLCERLDIVDIGPGADFRLDRLKGQPVWHVPADDAARSRLDAAFATLTDNARGAPYEITVQGRELVVPCEARGIARFDFDTLCREARGAADYLAIAGNFHTVIIDDIPRLSPNERDVAKRFVILIDALYEHRVNLFASAAAPAADLYPAGDTAFEFERTVSRLTEMQAEDYMAAPHLA